MKPDDAPLGALGSFFALFFLTTFTGALFFADCLVAMKDTTEHTTTGFREMEYSVLHHLGFYVHLKSVGQETAVMVPA